MSNFIYIYILFSIIAIGFLLYLYISCYNKTCSSYIPIKSWNPGYSSDSMNYIADNVCICGGSGGANSICENRELKQKSYDNGNTEYSIFTR